MESILYQRIKELCSKHSITIAKLESDLGFSNAVINKWKQNTSPSIDKVIKVAGYFDVSVEYLLGRSEIPTSISELLGDIDTSHLSMSEDKQRLLKKFCDCLNDDSNSYVFINSILQAIELSKNNVDTSSEYSYDIFVLHLSELMRQWRKRKEKERKEYEELKKQTADFEDLY